MRALSNQDQAKAVYERAIFKLFLEKQSWPNDESLFECHKPPEPDILYQSPEGDIAFELLEICASELARARNKTLDGDEEAAYVRTSDPTLRVVRRKLRKVYQTSFPIELLCYRNGRVVTPDDLVWRNITIAIQYARATKIRRVWYFGKHDTYWNMRSAEGKGESHGLEIGPGNALQTLHGRP